MAAAKAAFPSALLSEQVWMSSKNLAKNLQKLKTETVLLLLLLLLGLILVLFLPAEA